MKCKYVINKTMVIKETYSRNDVDFPYDRIDVFHAGMTIEDVRLALENAYEAGRRHVKQEVIHFVEDVK